MDPGVGCWFYLEFEWNCMLEAQGAAREDSIDMCLHGGYPFDIRQSFFSLLSEAFQKTSVNGRKLICGDLSSRIQKQLSGEDLYFGAHVFGQELRNLFRIQTGNYCWSYAFQNRCK